VPYSTDCTIFDSCQIENCIECEGYNICKKCENGYALMPDGSCKEITNKEEYLYCSLEVVGYTKFSLNTCFNIIKPQYSSSIYQTKYNETHYVELRYSSDDCTDKLVGYTFIELNGKLNCSLDKPTQLSYEMDLYNNETCSDKLPYSNFYYGECKSTVFENGTYSSIALVEDNIFNVSIFNSSNCGGDLIESLIVPCDTCSIVDYQYVFVNCTNPTGGSSGDPDDNHNTVIILGVVFVVIFVLLVIVILVLVAIVVLFVCFRDTRLEKSLRRKLCCCLSSSNYEELK